MTTFFYQVHGYKNGHQLLSNNISLNRIDQDTIDRLSDISGPLKPGETFDPYITCYPLPSKEHFVIARTWQDLTVQRAGCVVTKSLIILMTEWESSKNIGPIFQALLNSSSDKEEGIKPETFESRFIFPVVNSPVDELVESLFLENRQPILMFNCVEPEKIIIRLYSVLWTSLRKNFSACTFSLSQRSIGGKPFDLLFAPGTVKSKFSDWPGRRIDGMNTSAKGPRHRWTSELAHRIFSLPTPTLFGEENGSFIKFDDNSDESTLRLSLLWDELLNKAENEASPLAILGLLDIINSQPIFATELYQKLQPYIYNSIHNASSKLADTEAWRFFSSLLVKHKRKLMDRKMLTSVKICCAELTEKNPFAAMDFISNYDHPSNSIPAVLFAGIGDGLADSIVHETIVITTKDISLELLLSLLATSKKFSQVFANDLAEKKHDWNYDNDNLFSINIPKYRAKAKKNLAPFINNIAHKPLLRAILKDTDVQLYRYIIGCIGKNTGFGLREFDEAIIDATHALHQYTYLKDIVVANDKDGNADSLVAKIVEFEPSLFKWLCFELNISQNRKLFIIQTVFDRISEEMIKLVSEDQPLSTCILSILISNLKKSEFTLACFLTFADIPVDEAVLTFNNLTVESIHSVKTELITKFLSKAVKEVSLQNEQIVSDILLKSDQVVVDDLLDDCISNKNSQQQIIRNLRVLLLAGPNFRAKLLNKVNYISRVLANNLPDYVDKNLSDAWVSLLNESHSYHDKQKKSAAIILDYSYSCKKFDPTDLLEAAFPIVYKTFLNGSSIGQFFPFMFFSDWDKCRTLRQDLVHRYLESNWSRLGLFKVALKTEILKEVLSILYDYKSGKKFIEQAINDAKSSNNYRIMEEIFRFFKLR